MCRTSNLIHRKKSLLNLNNEDIARKLNGEGITVGEDAVGSYFRGKTGVPIENLGAFLRALDLKVVEADHPDMSDEEIQALRLLAGKYLKPAEQD